MKRAHKEIAQRGVVVWIYFRGRTKMKYHKVFSIASICPRCGEKGYIWDIREDMCQEGLARRRKCKKCNARWKTIELMYDEFKEAYNEGKFD